MKRPEDLLGSDNYFHWEFNMRMKLARKGLLIHILKEVKENEITESWRVLDLKAYAIIAQGIEVEHQSKIRNAQTAKHAWDILRDYYNRSNIQNRVTLTRRLHEFKMEEGSSMSNHLDRFGELVVAMEAVGDPMNEARQLVILLSSLPAEHDTIVTVIENTHGLSLDEVKEKLLKQYEKMQQQEPTEGASRARQRGGRNGRMNNRQYNGDQSNDKPRKFMGTCHACGRHDHKQYQCRSKKKETDETVFMAHATCEQAGNGSWLIDSGASSHMSPYREDFVTYQELRTPIEVSCSELKIERTAYAARSRRLPTTKTSEENGVESLYTRVFRPRDIDNFFEAETRNSSTTLQLGPHWPRGGERFLILCGTSSSRQRFPTPGGGPTPERSLQSPTP